ncbi:MAG: FlgD immunoglobulin-like domain containing protein [Bacteroidales bacterium]
MRNIITALILLLIQECSAQMAPSLQFTFIPDWGSVSLLRGKVHNSTLYDHGVIVYIFVEEAGGWWNKPYAASAVTNIQPDSSFNTNIAIDGNDQFATRIIAFLTPLSFSPPQVSGGELPAALFAFPHVVSGRPHGNRIISWSGFDWVVKKSITNNLIPVGPGPNIFNDNDSMVWVDTQEKLHLRIAKRGNEWHCTEIISTVSQGYNRYEFDLGSRVDLLDPNIIAGIFTWDECSPYAQPPNNYFREIDFEFSKWGNSGNENSQYVVQPWSISGNINRFNMTLTGLSHSIHTFDWTSDSIVFKSSWGDFTHSWKYTDQASIPSPGNENVRINFWLLNGIPPSDNRNAELILNTFVTNTAEHGHLTEQVKVFPNPVESGCTIDVHSSGVNEAAISITDIYGNHVKELFAGKLIIGLNRIEWDGMNQHGQPLQPGLYIICVRNIQEIRYVKLIKI